jgi:hypothetical protein
LNIEKREFLSIVLFVTNGEVLDFLIKIAGDFLEHSSLFVLENVNLKLFFLVNKQETNVPLMFYYVQNWSNLLMQISKPKL